jgi:hypothetical protein
MKHGRFIGSPLRSELENYDAAKVQTIAILPSYAQLSRNVLLFLVTY